MRPLEDYADRRIGNVIDPGADGAPLFMNDGESGDVRIATAINDVLRRMEIEHNGTSAVLDDVLVDAGIDWQALSGEVVPDNGSDAMADDDAESVEQGDVVDMGGVQSTDVVEANEGAETDEGVETGDGADGMGAASDDDDERLSWGDTEYDGESVVEDDGDDGTFDVGEDGDGDLSLGDEDAEDEASFERNAIHGKGGRRVR